MWIRIYWRCWRKRIWWGLSCDIREVVADGRCGRPKGKPKRGGLDVEAGRRYDEVQKGSRRVADWTLKRGEGMMKSKREAEEWQIGR